MNPRRLVLAPNSLSALKSSRRFWITLALCVGSPWIAGALPEDVLSVVAPALLIGGFAYGVWKRPPVAVFLLLMVAALFGDWLILVAAPVTVMLARRDNRMRLGVRRNIGRTLNTILLAALALIITAFFAHAAMGPRSGQPDSSPATAAPSSAREGGIGERGLLQRVMQWLGFGDGGQSVPAPGRFEEPEPDPNHWPWILAIAALLVVAALGWYLWRRWRRPRGLAPAASARALARLEAVGKTVGRRRRPNEGALTYASELAALTGDRRLDPAGPLVSGQVYQSSSADPVAVEENLTTLERTPPPRPPKPPLPTRVRRRLRNWGFTPMRVAITTAAASVLLLAGWWLTPRLGDLSGQNEAIAYGVSQPLPDGWLRLVSAPGESLDGWEMCGIAGGAYSVAYSAAGRAFVDEPVAATITAVQYDSSAYTSFDIALTDGDEGFTMMTGSQGGAPPAIETGWVGDVEPHVPLVFFDSIEAVTSQLQIIDAVRTEHRDRAGAAFTRFESQPIAYDRAYSRSGAPALTVGSPITDLVWVTDVWTSATGRPSRVRVMSGEPTPRWYEWRRLEEVDTGILEVPDCPETVEHAAELGWMGAEPFEQTLVVPPRIAFDDDGNPYDSPGWGPSEPGLETTVIEVLDGPLQALTFGDVWDLEVGERAASATVSTDWEVGAELSMIEIDYWPVAVRIDRQDAAAPVVWQDEAALDVYESFLVMSSAGPPPAGEPWDIASLIEPLWEEADVVAADLDGRPGADTWIVPLGDATTITGGYDAERRLVSLVVRGEWTPWRQMGLAGTPPAAVLGREAELRACLDGDRPLEPDGRCRSTDAPD